MVEPMWILRYQFVLLGWLCDRDFTIVLLYYILIVYWL